MNNSNIQAMYLNGCQVQPITLSSRGELVPLVSSLVVAPGEYSVMARGYSLQVQGLYRFMNPPLENRQCIVFYDDVFALMSAIAWLVSHGYRDNDKSFDQLKALACTGKLVVTCGSCSAFAVQLFKELQLDARTVQTLSLQDRNGYNDGHVLTEVKTDGKWIVFDPDAGSLYSHGGEWLNILQLTQQARHGDFQRHPLSAAVPIATGHFAANGYAYDMWYETALSTEEMRQQTFQRILQVPVIIEHNASYFTTATEGERRRIEDLYPEDEFIYIAPEEFCARFYPRGD